MRVIGAGLAAAILGLAAPAAAQEITAESWTWKAIGQVEVVDGDTLRMKGVRIGLLGIDAPELEQVCYLPGKVPWGCGVAAKVHLEGLIAGREVKCFGDDRPLDREKQQQAICHVWGVWHLNSQMVQDGFAMADRRTSARYAGNEAIARDERNGLWTSSFVPPWEWRATMRKKRPET